MCLQSSRTSELLSELADEGAIVTEGTGRGTKYRTPSLLAAEPSLRRE